MISTDGFGAAGSIRLARSMATRSWSAIASSARSRRNGASRTAGSPSGSDRRHVGAGGFDPQHFDVVAKQVARAGLQRGVAAAVEHKLWIAAEQPGRVDAERQVALDAKFGGECDNSLGVPVDPRAFHGVPNGPFDQPPAKRRDHQPLRRGLSVFSPSPTSVMTGCGGGDDGCAGVGCAASAAIAVGAGSRTVERLRGGSVCCAGANARGASAMAGALDVAGAANGGAASRSATASLSSASVGGAPVTSSGDGSVSFGS